MKTIEHCTHQPNCGEGLSDPRYLKNIASEIAPQLEKEWHSTKNGCRKLSDYTGATPKKAWWMCATCGNEWEASVGNRVRLGAGCPPCGISRRNDPVRGKLRPIKIGMSLQERYPQIAQYWHPTKNGDLKASKIGTGTEKRIWLMCICGNEYSTTPASKIMQWKATGKVICRKCYPLEKTRPKLGKSLADIYPETSKQFDMEKNYPRTPYDYNPRANAYVWWICDKKHSTYALINSKILGHECNECQVSTKSKIENDFRQLAIPSIFLKNVATDSVRIPLIWRKQKIAMLDALGETLNGVPVAIEYDGEYYHQFSEMIDRDVAKTNALLSAGYLVIRIRERQLPFVNVQHPNLYQVSHNYTRRYIREAVSLRETFSKIEQWLQNK